GKSNRSLEGARDTLGGEHANLAGMRRLERRTLGAANGQHVLLEADVELRMVDARQLGDEEIRVLPLDDVDRRDPDAILGERRVDRLVDGTVEREHAIERRVQSTAGKHGEPSIVKCT